MSRLISPHNYSFEANCVSWGFITSSTDLQLVTETFWDTGLGDMNPWADPGEFYTPCPSFSASAMCEVLTTHVAVRGCCSLRCETPIAAELWPTSAQLHTGVPEKYGQPAFHHNYLKAAFYAGSFSWQSNSCPSLMTKQWLMKARVPSQNTHPVS